MSTFIYKQMRITDDKLTLNLIECDVTHIETFRKILSIDHG